jgi:hypothetical protein
MAGFILVKSNSSELSGRSYSVVERERSPSLEDLTAGMKNSSDMASPLGGEEKLLEPDPLLSLTESKPFESDTNEGESSLVMALPFGGIER